MASININLAIGPRDGHRFHRVRAVVNLASSYTVMPSTLLEMLGVDPQWTDSLEAPDGSRQEFSLAEVMVEIEGRQRTTICVFGKADTTPVVGKYTLDGFGLAMDQASGKLAPGRLVLE